MDATGALQTAIERAGLHERLTPQRRAVWQALAGTPGHLTVETILAALQPSFPSLNSGTVYRELKWLQRLGLICETDVGRGPKVYERVTDPPHHHLVCLQCGHLGDLSDSYFSSARRGLESDLGFHARIEHFAVYGVCQRCASRGQPAAK